MFWFVIFIILLFTVPPLALLLLVLALAVKVFIKD